ncbi:MAG: LamG-like jellyroll fold domain-containing protein [Planctomycetota bacterium]|nr:LamG-like jellyroll fold domain-containing protein [Planctomycetota bacterium]
MKSFCGMLFVGLAVCSAAPEARASHTLGYLFDETGVTATADGSAAAIAPMLFLEGGNGLSSDLHGEPGSGVSGLPGDRALDLTSTSGMGMSGGGRGRHAMAPNGFNADFDAIDSSTAFTIAGWFKTDSTEQIGMNAVLVSNAPLLSFGPQGGFVLQGGNTPGSLSLGVNTAALSNVNRVQSSPAFGATESWVNFAVTYDGTQTTNNVRFFRGTPDSPLVLTDTLTLNAGVVGENNFPLIIGNTEANLNGFDGFLDNIRIWNEVIPLSALRTIGETDVVPEPCTLALLLAASGVGVVIVARKKRQCN